MERALWQAERLTEFGPNPFSPVENAATDEVRGTRPRTLKAGVQSKCENIPGVYGMLDEHGVLIYVGKSKQLRTRLLSYFSPKVRNQKPGRLIRQTRRILWEPAPTEFAALLRELQLIQTLAAGLERQRHADEHAVHVPVCGPAHRAGRIALRQTGSACVGDVRTRFGRAGGCRGRWKCSIGCFCSGIVPTRSRWRLPIKLNYSRKTPGRAVCGSRCKPVLVPACRPRSQNNLFPKSARGHGGFWKAKATSPSPCCKSE